MTETKTINASNWTGESITIELLSDLSFKLHGYTVTLVEKIRDEFGPSYAITTNDHEGSIGTVHGFNDKCGNNYLAVACGIEREGPDLLTVAAQLLANTL